MVDTTFTNKDVEFVSTYSHRYLGVILTLLKHRIQHYKIFHTLLRKFFLLEGISKYQYLNPIGTSMRFVSVSELFSVKIILFLITVYHLHFL